MVRVSGLTFSAIFMVRVRFRVIMVGNALYNMCRCYAVTFFSLCAEDAHAM